MSTQSLPVIAGNLPSGSCPASLQEMLNLFSQFQSVQLNTQGVSIVTSATKPSDQSVVWNQLDSLGRYVRTYLFAQGAWLSPHPLVPGIITIWSATIPDFTTFDGGDANALSDTSGPMWESVMTSTFPIGAGGTLPSGAPGPAVNQTGGEDLHVLIQTELPAVGVNINCSNNGVAGGPNFLLNPQTAPGTSIVTSANLGSGVGHNNMPPYRGVYFLERTNRLFYTVT